MVDGKRNIDGVGRLLPLYPMVPLGPTRPLATATYLPHRTAITGISSAYRLHMCFQIEQHQHRCCSAVVGEAFEKGGCGVEILGFERSGSESISTLGRSLPSSRDCTYGKGIVPYVQNTLGDNCFLHRSLVSPLSDEKQPETEVTCLASLKWVS